MEMKPEEPLPPDCCGMGCRNCVLDLYRGELELSQRASSPVVVQGSGDSPQFMSPEAYVPCQITQVERHNKVSCIYSFKLPENFAVQSKFGDHLIAREVIDGRAVARCYTTLNSAGVSKEFAVLVKTYETGIMSKAVLEKWLPGHVVDWRGPFGDFQYKVNSFRKILLLAAGTGVVPLFQLSRRIVDNEDDETLVKLIFCCRNYDEIPLREQVRQLQQFWNFQSSIYLSQDSGERIAAVKKHNEIITCDKLTREGLQKELKAFNASVDNTLVLICGTNSFEYEFMNCLIDLGFPPSNVVKL